MSPRRCADSVPPVGYWCDGVRYSNDVVRRGNRCGYQTVLIDGDALDFRPGGVEG